MTRLGCLAVGISYGSAIGLLAAGRDSLALFFAVIGTISLLAEAIRHG